VAENAQAREIAELKAAVASLREHVAKGTTTP
jgi:hypothetical protein